MSKKPTLFNRKALIETYEQEVQEMGLDELHSFSQRAYEIDYELGQIVAWRIITLQNETADPRALDFDTLD